MNSESILKGCMAITVICGLVSTGLMDVLFIIFALFLVIICWLLILYLDWEKEYYFKKAELKYKKFCIIRGYKREQ